MINVQHDVGKWCTEYSWSAEDEMWGIKFLHNFDRLGSLGDVDEGGTRLRGLKRVDEEEPVEGGLRGRVSIGGEVYFSAKEKSAGGEFSANIPNPYKPNFFNSVDWNSIHDTSRYPSVAFSDTWFATLLTVFVCASVTTNHYNCFVQSYAWAYLYSVYS